MKNGLLRFIVFIIFLSIGSVSAQSSNQTIAVLGFTSDNIGNTLLNKLTVKFSSELSALNEYILIDREKRKEEIAELENILKNQKDEGNILEAGKLLSAQNIIYGSLQIVGESILFNIKIVNLETGITTGSFSDTYSTFDSIISNSKIILTHLLTKKTIERPKVAVLDFNYSKMTSIQAKAFTDFIISSLDSLDEYLIIDREQRDLFLDEMNFSLSGLTENESALKIGRLLTASYLIKGSIGSIVNNRFFLNMQLIDVKTAEVVSSVSEKYITIEDLLKDSYRIIHSFAGIEERYKGLDLTNSFAYQTMMHENWYTHLWAYGANISLSYRLDLLASSSVSTANIGGGISWLLGSKNLMYFDFSYQIPLFYHESLTTGEAVIHPSGLSAYDSRALFYISLGWARRIHLSQKSALLWGLGLQYGNITLLENGNFDEMGDDDFVSLGIGPAGKITYLLNFNDRFLIGFGVGINYNTAFYVDAYQSSHDSQNLSIIPEIVFYTNQRKR